MATANPSYYRYNTPHGVITVAVRGNKVIAVTIGPATEDYPFEPTPVGNKAATEILQYLSGKRRWFSVEVSQQGSDFQKAVWKEVSKIPYGQHRTAAEVAEAIGHPGSHKAVGQALRANKIALIVPTHRVTNAQGKPWGTGKPAALRAAFLKLEEESL